MLKNMGRPGYEATPDKVYIVIVYYSEVVVQVYKLALQPTDHLSSRK